MINLYKTKPSDFRGRAAAVCCYCEWKGKFLFLRKSPGQRHAHKWVAPGGTVEQNEELEDAMVRELFEETAIVLERTKIRPIEHYYVRKPDVDFTLYLYHTELEHVSQIVLSQEHDEIRWVTLDQALKLPLIEGAETFIKKHVVHGL